MERRERCIGFIYKGSGTLYGTFVRDDRDKNDGDGYDDHNDDHDVNSNVRLWLYIEVVLSLRRI